MIPVTLSASVLPLLILPVSSALLKSSVCTHEVKQRRVTHPVHSSVNKRSIVTIEHLHQAKPGQIALNTLDLDY